MHRYIRPVVIHRPDSDGETAMASFFRIMVFPICVDSRSQAGFDLYDDADAQYPSVSSGLPGCRVILVSHLHPLAVSAHLCPSYVAIFWCLPARYLISSTTRARPRVLVRKLTSLKRTNQSRNS